MLTNPYPAALQAFGMQNYGNYKAMKTNLLLEEKTITGQKNGSFVLAKLKIVVGGGEIQQQMVKNKNQTKATKLRGAWLVFAIWGEIKK